MCGERADDEEGYREAQTPVQRNPERKQPLEAHVPSSHREVTSKSTLSNAGIAVSSVLFLFGLSLYVSGYGVAIPAILFAFALLAFLVAIVPAYRVLTDSQDE